MDFMLTLSSIYWCILRFKQGDFDGMVNDTGMDDLHYATMPQMVSYGNLAPDGFWADFVAGQNRGNVFKTTPIVHD